MNALEECGAGFGAIDEQLHGRIDDELKWSRRGLGERRRGAARRVGAR